MARRWNLGRRGLVARPAGASLRAASLRPCWLHCAAYGRPAPAGLVERHCGSGRPGAVCRAHGNKPTSLNCCKSVGSPASLAACGDSEAQSMPSAPASYISRIPRHGRLPASYAVPTPRQCRVRPRVPCYARPEDVGGDRHVPRVEPQAGPPITTVTCVGRPDTAETPNCLPAHARPCVLGYA